jgi:hypothetical protein
VIPENERLAGLLADRVLVFNRIAQGIRRVRPELAAAQPVNEPLRPMLGRRAGRAAAGYPPSAVALGWVSRMNTQARMPETAVSTAATPMAASRLARAAVTPPIRAPIA